MSNLFTLGILMSILSLGIGVPVGCPNVEDMRPCTCRRVAYGLHVICAGFNDSSTLTKVFKILRDYKVQTVLWHGLNLDKALPDSMFEGIQITEIRVEQSQLMFGTAAFSGLDTSLHILNVAKKSNIKVDDRFSLAKLSHLKEFSVQSNSIPRVTNIWLNEKIPNVNVIELDNNNIKVVEDKAFENLKELKQISLSQNQIEVVKRSMFPSPADKLERIDLSFNKISELPSDFFSEMKSLKEIILTDNNLKHLPENTWAPVWEQFDRVFLSKNNLVCDEKMDWIKNLRLPNLEGNCASPKALEGKTIREVYHHT